MKRKIILICFAVLMIATVVLPWVYLVHSYREMPQGESGSFYAGIVAFALLLMFYIPIFLLTEGETCHFLLYMISGKEKKCKEKTILNVLSLLSILSFLALLLVHFFNRIRGSFLNHEILGGLIRIASLIFAILYISIKGFYFFQYRYQQPRKDYRI